MQIYYIQPMMCVIFRVQSKIRPAQHVQVHTKSQAVNLVIPNKYYSTFNLQSIACRASTQ